jgi:hypothetical protein
MHSTQKKLFAIEKDALAYVCCISLFASDF